MRIFRRFIINNIGIGPISSTLILNRAFLLGFLIDALVII